MNQVEKSFLFRKLHEVPNIFVLPNAWDVITARIYESVGFSAVGTTSAGIAVALGYADGERIPVAEMVGVIKRIANSVDVPVTADVESGYGETIRDSVENVEHFIEAGAVGINIEDTVYRFGRRVEEPRRQAEKIAAIHELSLRLGIPFMINARIDSLYGPHQEIDDRLADIFFRAELYRTAGADCIFVFGEHDKAMISRIRRGVSGPLNVLAGASTPSVRELGDLGVTRVSLGPSVMKASLDVVKRISEELLCNGTYSNLNNVAMSYQEMFGYVELSAKIQEQACSSVIDINRATQDTEL